MPRKFNEGEVKEVAVFLGRAIRKLRREKKIKAIVLAMDAGVTEQSISLIETGKMLPSLVLLGRLAEALGTEDWRLLAVAHRLREANALMKKPQQEDLDEQ